LTSGVGQIERAGAPARGRRAPAASATAVTSAVIVATAVAEGGGAAAAQRFQGEPVLRRMLGQLASVGVPDVLVLTRPELAAELAPAVEGTGARLEPGAGPADDLRAVEAHARATTGGIVVLAGEVVTQREALAGLLVDPRLGTAALSSSGVAGKPFAFRLRSRRGRVVSAASPYHSTYRSTASFLGVLKVGAAEHAAFADLAGRLAALLSPQPPADWQEELRRKAGVWKVSLHNSEVRRAALEAGEEPPARDPEAPPLEPDALTLEPADEAELRRRVAAAPGDVTALLLTALVRSGAHVGLSHLRKLFWARPLAPEALARAEERILDHDEDKVLLDSAVKASDGFFTTYFVSPYSKYIARWCAHRGFTPNQVTTLSVLIGVAAAIAFATGDRAGYIAGAVLLQAAFTTDCVDGQLARYSRQFSKLGAWLDSVFDRTKEYVVFAGLALGAEHAGHDVWLLAGAALTLQTVRHMLDFSFGATQHQAIGSQAQPPLEQPSDSLNPKKPAPVDSAEHESELQAEVPDALPRQQPLRRRLPRMGLRLWHRFDKRPPVFWGKKILAFPIGERFAAISITAALFTPRTTFTVLLVWGSIAAVYSLLGRILRSIAAP
jgi:CDP-alcohol phosphatidyltransferase-like enzyme